jgi:hypothetical protein
VFKAIGVIFGLFVICFIAIVIEELFLGGKRRRRAEKLFREKKHEDNTGDRT